MDSVTDATGSNLVELARRAFPKIFTCTSCHVVVRLLDGRWLDGAGGGWCWSGHLTHVGVPYVAPSPMLGRVQ
jgi:hypothetical protein